MTVSLAINWVKLENTKGLQFSCSVVSDSLRPHGLQHAKPLCPSPTPRVYSNSCPLSWWCHPTILSSVTPFSSRLQSFPASGWFVHSQSCPTLCDPVDCNPPSSSDHGIFQARILECIAVSYSRASSWPRDWTLISCIFCINRKILYEYATWEVPSIGIFLNESALHIRWPKY